jgi:tRNA G18 (ribose-2'-O)-methylase SpoU
MGAQFLTRVVVDVTPGDMAAKVEAGGRRGSVMPEMVVADLQGDVRAEDLSVPGPLVLVLGAERGDLPEFAVPTKRVVIPQAGFDSLNVAMAGTILLYELTRGRLGKGVGGLLA